MADTVQSCPFCGHTAALVKEDRFPFMPPSNQDDPDRFAYFYRCSGCAAHGPWMKSEEGALRLWNIREDTSQGEKMATIEEAMVEEKLANAEVLRAQAEFIRAQVEELRKKNE